jgi:hypothetical protein
MLGHECFLGDGSSVACDFSIFHSGKCTTFFLAYHPVNSGKNLVSFASQKAAILILLFH